MLVLHAGKRNLHKFVSQCEKVPTIHHTNFWKSLHSPIYFLTWNDGEVGCRAILQATIYGHPILIIERHDADGNELSRFTHRPSLEQLREFGLVQERTGTRGLSKAFESEARGLLS